MNQAPSQYVGRLFLLLRSVNHGVYQLTDEVKAVGTSPTWHLTVYCSIYFILFYKFPSYIVYWWGNHIVSLSKGTSPCWKRRRRDYLLTRQIDSELQIRKKCILVVISKVMEWFSFWRFAEGLIVMMLETVVLITTSCGVGRWDNILVYFIEHEK
jgi:hypothetical protein